MEKDSRSHAKRHAAKIARRLAVDYADARCALNFNSPLELLVATILSAQCTDTRVNLVTKDLFARYRSAADFASLRQGDILVAPITTPTYNAILPLLGGIVTDRGGLLSHPAIVSREYGFPGVVGTRDATVRIPDGALVEIDGDAGTVRVLTI